MADRKNGKKPGSDLPDTGEEQFDTLLGNNPLPAFVIDVHSGDPEQYRFLTANKAALSLYGYSEQELKSMRLLDLHPPEEYSNVIEQVAPNREPESGGFETQRPFIHLKKDGSRIHVDVHAHRVRFDGRKARIAIVRNVSDRVEAKRTLQESEERYRLLVEKSLVGVYLVQEGKFVYVNNRMAEMMGYTSTREMEGRSIQDLIYPEDWPVMEENFRRRLAGEVESVQYRFRALKKDGSLVHVEVLGGLVTIGDKPAILGTAMDITEREVTDQRLRLFSAAVDSAPIGVQLVDLEGRIIYSNPAVERIYGFSHEEYLGKHVNEMNADPTFADKKILPPIKKKGRWAGELEVKHKDGHTFPIALTTSMVHDDEGNPIAMVGLIQDVTERKKAEMALQKSEELFRKAFQTSPESLVISRLKDGLFVDVNQGFCDLSGYMREEVIGKTSNEINIWFDPENREKMVEGLKKDGQVQDLEFRVRRKDNEIRDAMLSASLIMTGDEPQLLTVTRDITELKMAQDSLEQAFNELEIKNRDLEAFLYTAAHDLRTPLVSVKGYVELMQRSMKERMNEEETHMCQRISSNVDHFDDLLSDLLSFSRAGVQNGERLRIRIEPLVSRILEEERAWDIAPRVDVLFAEDLPDVSLHQVRAHEVFSNLISNCLKFRHPDRTLQIVVGLKPADGKKIPPGHDLFFVRDNGQGIERGFQHMAFDLFARPRDSRMDGTGVGLAIVKRVVDEEGGLIWIESTPGEGTTIYFTLPIAD
ncbi:PAS domain S-box protein [bacterium]|nr:MAG: PAS domain S-box protein [bacterium]